MINDLKNMNKFLLICICLLLGLNILLFDDLQKTTDRADKLYAQVQKTTDRADKLYAQVQKTTDRAEKLSAQVQKTTDRAEKLSAQVYTLGSMLAEQNAATQAKMTIVEVNELD